MTQKTTLLALSIAATAAVLQERFVSAAGAPAAPAGNALGASETDAAIGQIFTVNAIGTAIVTAGGAIAKGAAIEVGAAGKAVTKNAGITVARALQAASADGDRIEVLLIQN
ncbi:capsid cement protein [Pseudoxanthomonas sp. 22568]|uniref:capsid cement protein n=1 Tax=Pseudoxanthomonas sp. 22568 TaxID=3453945 RepID=UPI003F854A29